MADFEILHLRERGKTFNQVCPVTKNAENSLGKCGRSLISLCRLLGRHKIIFFAQISKYGTEEAIVFASLHTIVAFS